MKKLFLFLIIACYLATLTNSFTIYNDGGEVKATKQVSPILVEDIPKQESSPDLEVKTFIVTAYNTTVEQCDSDPCISASGKNVCGRNDTIACPRHYKFGTRFEILGKIYICEDRTSPKYGNRLDINFDKDMVGAIKFGKKTLSVKILIKKI